MNKDGDRRPARRAAAQLLTEDNGSNMTETDASVPLGDTQTEESELSHFIKELTRDGMGVLPILDIGDNLSLNELPNGVANRLEILVDVDRLQGIATGYLPMMSLTVAV